MNSAICPSDPHQRRGISAVFGRIHRDESGVEVVQALLLVILGLVALYVLYKLVAWVVNWMKSESAGTKGQADPIKNTDFGS